jgi:hypothetical protein
MMSTLTDLDVATVIARLRDIEPEPVREHGVRIGGVVYPVKQAFERAVRLPRTAFTSHIALRHLRNLGFEIVSKSVPSAAPATVEEQQPPTASLHQWPWEGSVQTTFGHLLYHHGWSITSMADTATKAAGVDVLAAKDARRLGAEVKGWPSTGYADPRRADEGGPAWPVLFWLPSTAREQRLHQLLAGMNLAFPVASPGQSRRRCVCGGRGCGWWLVTAMPHGVWWTWPISVTTHRRTGDTQVSQGCAIAWTLRGLRQICPGREPLAG